MLKRAIAPLLFLLFHFATFVYADDSETITNPCPPSAIDPLVGCFTGASLVNPAVGTAFSTRGVTATSGTIGAPQPQSTRTAPTTPLLDGVPRRSGSTGGGSGAASP